MVGSKNAFNLWIKFNRMIVKKHHLHSPGWGFHYDVESHRLHWWCWCCQLADQACHLKNIDKSDCIHVIKARTVIRNMVTEIAFQSSLGAIIRLGWRWHMDITWCQICIRLGDAWLWPCNSSRCLICKNPLTRPKPHSRKYIWSFFGSLLGSLLLSSLVQCNHWLVNILGRLIYCIRKQTS